MRWPRLGSRAGRWQRRLSRWRLAAPSSAPPRGRASPPRPPHRSIAPCPPTRRPTRRRASGARTTAPRAGPRDRRPRRVPAGAPAHGRGRARPRPPRAVLRRAGERVPFAAIQHFDRVVAVGRVNQNGVLQARSVLVQPTLLSRPWPAVEPTPPGAEQPPANPSGEAPPRPDASVPPRPRAGGAPQPQPAPTLPPSPAPPAASHSGTGVFRTAMALRTAPGSLAPAPTLSAPRLQPGAVRTAIARRAPTAAPTLAVVARLPAYVPTRAACLGTTARGRPQQARASRAGAAWPGAYVSVNQPALLGRARWPGGRPARGACDNGRRPPARPDGDSPCLPTQPRPCLPPTTCERPPSSVAPRYAGARPRLGDARRLARLVVPPHRRSHCRRANAVQRALRDARPRAAAAPAQRQPGLSAADLLGAVRSPPLCWPRSCAPPGRPRLAPRRARRRRRVRGHGLHRDPRAHKRRGGGARPDRDAPADLAGRVLARLFPGRLGTAIRGRRCAGPVAAQRSATRRPWRRIGTGSAPRSRSGTVRSASAPRPPAGARVPPRTGKGCRPPRFPVHCRGNCRVRREAYHVGRH